MRTVPEIGVHPNVPDRVYHQWDALSNTWLNKLHRSPAHLKSYWDQPFADTPAMRLGRAAHCAILEPDKFNARYVAGPEGDRRTKAVKAAWADLKAEYPDCEFLTPNEMAQVIGMRDSVWKKEMCKTLLGGEGDAELAVVWDDDGILCRGLADRVSYKLKGGTIVDLKTTEDARRDAFERTIFNYGYYRQGAWYLRGFARHNVEISHYTIVAIEKKPPYEAIPYRLNETAISAGWDEIEPLLGLYAECRDKNEWPGYKDETVDIALPTWAWGRIEEGSER